jgi:hypothetical protein
MESRGIAVPIDTNILNSKQDLLNQANDSRDIL